MGAIWARRQKSAAGSVAKKRRTIELDEALVPIKNRSEPSVPDNGGTNDEIETTIEQVAKDAENTPARPEEPPVQSIDRQNADFTNGPEPDIKIQKPGSKPEPKSGPKSGPRAGHAHIRTSTAVDYQKDTCKEFKTRGTCRYGDACKFLHERGDSAASIPAKKEWKHVDRISKPDLVSSLKPQSAGCSICDLVPPNAAVSPQCGHRCCESCFIKASKDPGAKCPVCAEFLGHTAESVA